MPQLTRLVVRLSTQRPGFNITLFHVGLVTDKLEMVQVFFFFNLLSIPVSFHQFSILIHLSMTTMKCSLQFTASLKKQLVCLFLTFRGPCIVSIF